MRSGLNSGYKEIRDQIAGSWIEENSDCEAKLEFGPDDRFTVFMPNSEAVGNYFIRKAVIVPTATFCKINDCFVVEYKLETTRMVSGCSNLEHSLDDDSISMLFHFNAPNSMVYWTEIEFKRVN